VLASVQTIDVALLSWIIFSFPYAGNIAPKSQNPHVPARKQRHTSQQHYAKDISNLLAMMIHVRFALNLERQHPHLQECESKNIVAIKVHPSHCWYLWNILLEDKHEGNDR